MRKTLAIHHQEVDKLVLIFSTTIALVYFAWWLLPSNKGNTLLYSLLLIGEVYHVGMALAFWWTVWPHAHKEHPIKKLTPFFKPKVDVFITVVNEPLNIICQTATAALDMHYSDHTVYILNDGYVSGNTLYREVEKLACRIGVQCITRSKPGGAKAGNINHALQATSGEIVVILDSDMIPHRDFLQKVVPYFQDKRIGFIQTPQYYSNASLNEVTKGSWEQQEFFFGPIMAGKDSYNASFICGTNVAIRRKTLESVGGMYSSSITEDFLTSVYIHKKGWLSHYHDEILCEGLAPQDLQSYYKQQLRWAKGSFEILVLANPLFVSGLKLPQKIQYLFSAFFYLNGLIVLIDLLIPLVYLFLGIQPVASSTTSFVLFFLPFLSSILYTIYITSGENLTFRAIAFTHASFFLHLVAQFSVILRLKTGFTVTPKTKMVGNYLKLVYPHLLFIFIFLVGGIIGFRREGINPAWLANTTWCLFNVIMFLPFIHASYPWSNLLKPFIWLSNSLNYAYEKVRL